MFVILTFLSFILTNHTDIYGFEKDKSTANWLVVDDGVMGGLSKGKLTVNDDGYGVFAGHVSLDNNGGFSSLRYQFKAITLEGENTIILRIKGDGKQYQFRVKDKLNQYHSYIYEFQTSGEWQTVKIPFKEMYPSFRGRRLTIPNFNHTQIEEIAFLISNKKEETFEIMIDKISLQ